MRAARSLAAARARRREGAPVDLDRERRATNRIESLLRIPRGVSLTRETLGGVPVQRLSSGGGDRGTLLYFHGGAYVLGSARQALAHARLCADGGPDIVSVEYRLAPEHPCPAAVDDAIAVYRALLNSCPPQRVVTYGESAGGGLSLLLLQRAAREGLRMPAAVIAAFPTADLSWAGPSSMTNVGKDMLTRSELVQEASWFAGDRDLQDPTVSPLYGSFRGFPHSWISVGTHDLLLDDARRVTSAMEAEGVHVALHEWPGAIHSFTALPLPEGRRYRQLLNDFVSDALP